MSSKKDIPRLYKPDYIGEKQQEDITKQLIALTNGNLSLKKVKGYHRTIIDMSQTKQQKMMENLNRKIKYDQIVRRFEVFFNQKLNKYTTTYINNLSNLLTQKSKGYSQKRKQLTLKNETINIKSIKEPRIRPKKKVLVFQNKTQADEKQNNVIPFIRHANSPHIVVHNKKGSKIQIIDPKDDEFLSYEPKMYYDCDRILNRLNNETQFFFSQDKTYQKVLKNRIKRNLKNIFHKEAKESLHTSINKKIIWDRINRSTSYEVLPSKQLLNRNIYSRKSAKIMNLNNITHTNINSNLNHSLHNYKHKRNHSELMIQTHYHHGRNSVIPFSKQPNLSKTNTNYFFKTAK